MLCIAGFEDPEVMTAVNDVAQNPQNMKKYKDNKKVSATNILRDHSNVCTVWIEMCGARLQLSLTAF